MELLLIIINSGLMTFFVERLKVEAKKYNLEISDNAIVWIFSFVLSSLFFIVSLFVGEYTRDTTLIFALSINAGARMIYDILKPGLDKEWKGRNNFLEQIVNR